MPDVAIGIAINLALSVALGAVSKLLAPKPKKPQVNTEGRKQLIRSSIEEHRVIYGTSMESGPLIFAATSGSINEFLHLVIPLAAHEVEGIDSIFLNDIEITNAEIDIATGGVIGGVFAGKASIVKHLGSDFQTADTGLVSLVPEWTTAHRGRGLAYLAIRLTWDIDIFPQGIPNVRAVVRGRKVWDPRNDPGDPSVVAFSNNAALCQLDYLMSSFGFEVPLTEIDEASWIAAANVCDESVSLAAGGTQARYTCDGSFQVGREPSDIMESLLTASAGVAVYQQGTFRGYAGTSTMATNTLDEGDLRGEISSTMRPSMSDAFNSIRGTFIDADDPKAPFSLTDFPPIVNSTYVTEDNGEEVFTEIELSFTTNKIRAQRIANLFLNRARQGIVVNFPAKMTKLNIAPWDVITLSIDQMSWTDKEFRVLTWEATEDGGVDLTLQEEAAAIYTWDSADEITVDPAPDTNLPNAFLALPPVDLVLDSTEDQLFLNINGTLIPRILVTWSAPVDAFVSNYEVQWRNATAGESFQTFGLTSAANRTIFLSPAVQGDDYDIQIRSINETGVKSIFATVINHTVIGKSTAPPDVDTLFLNDRTLTWSYPNEPLDHRGFLLRSRPGSVAFWGDATPLHDGIITETTQFEITDLQGGTIVFMVKAVDTSGNESETPRRLVKDIGDPLLDNVVVVVDRHAEAFPGTITNGTINGGSGDLEADDSGALYWSAKDTSPVWTGNNKTFWTDTYLKMTYDTTWKPDASIVGADVTLKLLLTVQAEAWSLVFRFEGTIFWEEDSTLQFWSGTDTDTFWSQAVPEFIPWSGSLIPLRRQAYQFVLVTDAAAVRGIISRFLLEADVPDLLEKLNDVAIGAGGTRLPVTLDFQSILNVLITLQDDGGSATGVKVVDKSLSGPLINTVDDSGVNVAGNVDAQVQGF